MDVFVSYPELFNDYKMRQQTAVVLSDQTGKEHCRILERH
jgi:thioredoxin-related protein